jgi:tight adherence protein C
MVSPQKSDEMADIRTMLTWAGWRSEKTVAYFFGVKFCLAVVMGLLYLAAVVAGDSLTPRTFIFVFFPLTFGYYFPGFWLKNKVARRRQRIFRELPDVLDLLLICMEAGLSFDMALHRISSELAETAPVLSAEFGQYFLEIRSGLPRRRVLRHLAERNGHPNLTAVVNVLLQSVRFGTDVAEALRVFISTMRTERRQAAEEKGAKISNQLTFPLVVLILPALLIIILGPAIINIMDRLQGGL